MSADIFLRPEILSELVFEKTMDGRFLVATRDHPNERRAMPEEIIRQLMAVVLTRSYGYPAERVIMEYPVQMGSSTKNADIVVLDEDRKPLIVVEAKRHHQDKAFAQLNSYIAILKAPFGILVSMEKIIFVNREEEILIDVPKFDVSRHSTAFRSASETVELPVSYDLGIESFKIEKSRSQGKEVVIMGVQGAEIRVPIGDIFSYKKIRKHYLQRGVYLSTQFTQASWELKMTNLVKLARAEDEANETNSSLLTTSSSLLIKDALAEWILTWSLKTERERSRDAILLGRPWTDEETRTVYFRMKDFEAHLKRSNIFFTSPKVARQLRELGGASHVLWIKARATRVWMIPASEAENATNDLPADPT